MPERGLPSLHANCLPCWRNPADVAQSGETGNMLSVMAFVALRTMRVGAVVRIQGAIWPCLVRRHGVTAEQPSRSARMLQMIEDLDHGACSGRRARGQATLRCTHGEISRLVDHRGSQDVVTSERLHGRLVDWRSVRRSASLSSSTGSLVQTTEYWFLPDALGAKPQPVSRGYRAAACV